MIDGVLFWEVGEDIVFCKYLVIVIDEVYERSVNIDILIGMLSRVVKFRVEMVEEDFSVKFLKLIIMFVIFRVEDFMVNVNLFLVLFLVVEVEGC